MAELAAEVSTRRKLQRAVRLPVRFAQAVFVLMLIYKLYVTVVAPPFGDEAYYWMWGQKLGWSYFDHPPLHAWLLHVMGLVFSWSYVGLRGLSWLTLAGTLWIFWLWSKRLRPADPQSWFWPTAAIYLTAPVLFIAIGIEVHDHLLILLSLLAIHLLLVFVEKWEATGRSFGWLYAAAVALGLAVLTKYNGVLVGVGFALFFIVHRPVRPLWRSPHLYLAGLLSIALQAPVFWWNATEGFASYNFHFSERWGRPLFEFNPIFFVEFVLYAVIFIGPFLIPAMVGLVRRPLGAPFADRARILSLCVFVVTMLFLGFLSLFIEIYFYWNIVAFLPLMPLLAGWMKPWQLVAHSLYGIVTLGVALYHIAVLPIGYDWAYASAYGWDGVAARVEALEKEHPVGFVAASFYTTAAQLGFAMRDPDVTSLAHRHDQYDYWFDASAHKGEDAIVVSDTRYGANFSSLFDSVTVLETLNVARYGVVIYQPTIYLAHNFHGTRRP